MGFRGIIFDMDGTITAPNLEFARFNTAAGIGKVDTLDYLRSATGAEYDRVQALLMQFEEGGVANAKLNRGARRLLNYLKKRGMPTALLTRNSRKSVAGVCRKLNLQFDLVFTREDGPHNRARARRHANSTDDGVPRAGDWAWLTGGSRHGMLRT